jgi:serine/threonine protein kinase
MADDSTQIMAARPLPIGHLLLWYEIEEVLGQGGFGITYLATDTNLKRSVAIKEYLPTIFAYRNEDFTVAPLTGEHGDNYNWGLSSFLNEARTLAKFRHRNIVQVQTVFESHNTAYMVMEYEHGDSLSRLISKRRDSLDQSFYERLLFPVMDGLQDIHDAGFIHRDIKPPNIYLRSDGSPVLIDFGSARQTSQQDTGEMTTLVSQGYTPLEQYSSNFGEQGPWTDIYSFAASVYHGITGKRSVDALNRSAGLLAGKPDPLKPLGEMDLSGYSPVFLSAIDQAMMLKPDDRPQSLSQWREMFDADEPTVLHPVTVSVTAPESESVPEEVFTQVKPIGKPAAERRTTMPQVQPPEEEPKSSFIPFAGAAVLLLALGAGGWWFMQNQPVNVPDPLSADAIAQLPRPSSAPGIVDPRDRIKEELNELRTLASVYAEAIDIDPGSARAQQGVATVTAQLDQLSSSPLVAGNTQFNQQITEAVLPLAALDSKAAQLRARLQESTTLVRFSSLGELLDRDSLSAAEQQRLINGLASLQGADRDAAMRDPRFTALSDRFTRSIVRQVENRQFDQAARMIEVVMLFSPDDQRIVRLREHLQSGG